MATNGADRGVPPAEPAEGSREQGEYAEERVEQEQQDGTGPAEPNGQPD
jgi:hypothetical protein